MYIYFNKEGIITTQIPHGEVIRQGGTFTLSLCFEGIEDISKYSLTIAFKKPGEKEFGITWPMNLTERKEIFKKVKSSEVTYSFVDGNEYTLYDFFCNSTVGASEKYGNVQAIIKLCEKSSLVLEDGVPQTVENVIVMGLIQFYVEKIYGDKYDTNINIDQFNALITYLNQNLESVKKAYIKSINYEEETYTISVVRQDDSILTIDLPLENKLEEKDLKTINGESLVGSGNIEIKVEDDKTKVPIVSQSNDGLTIANIKNELGEVKIISQNKENYRGMIVKPNGLFAEYGTSGAGADILDDTKAITQLELEGILV